MTCLFHSLQWASEPVTVPSVPIQSGGGFGAPAPAPAEDWSATDTGDWSTTPAPAPATSGGTTQQWGGSSENWS